LCKNRNEAVLKTEKEMNTYAKYCPNVFLAQCTEAHEKGETIIVETRHGKENECIVHNLIFEKAGMFYYSITRADGFNTQQRAIDKAERLEGFAANAEARSKKYYEASQEGKEFLVLAEPIKVGHHSEKRHRALIERNWNRMGKSVAESEKAEELASRAEYWASMSRKIDISMPESIDFYAHKMEQKKERHEGLKSGKYTREHSFSLTYAKKELNEVKKLYELAKKLWA
jgi:hypothetical protein